MEWRIDRLKVVELLKKGAILEEWSNGVKGYSYNINAYTVRIETAQKLIKEEKVIELPPRPNSIVNSYTWNFEK
jgi:hypothetical protein